MAKDELHKQELESESRHIMKKIDERQIPRTNEPDDDWLKGTNASLCVSF